MWKTCNSNSGKDDRGDIDLKKLKVMTIIGTRPELIKLSETIKKCDQFFEHVLVHTGQNYDYHLNRIFFEDLSLREPDLYLNVADKNLGVSMGNVIARSYEAMLKMRPDAVLILGDTNSALSAIAAKRLKIPIFHMEAGNRCFDENLPEEINRRIVDHISDVNLPYTEHARRYLLAEGIRKEFIFVTGSPMREVLRENSEKIKASTVLSELGLEKKKYILLSAHREENIDHEAHFHSLMNAINELAEFYRMPIVYSVHPRSAKFLEKRKQELNPLIRKLPPFSFSDYNRLQQDAFCVVSDSGTLAEESAISHFPAVSIRTSTERPEAFEQGCFMLGGIIGGQLLRTVKMTVFLAQDGDFGSQVQDYTDDKVSSKVVRIIEGYTNVVNNRIWNK